MKTHVIALSLLILPVMYSTCALLTRQNAIKKQLIEEPPAIIEHLRQIRARASRLKDLACPLEYGTRSNYLVHLFAQALALAPHDFDALMNEYILEDIVREFMRFFAKDTVMKERLVTLFILNEQRQYYKDALIKIVTDAPSAPQMQPVYTAPSTAD